MGNPIIKYGTYAPSSHNAQMWSVKIKDNKIKLFPNYERVLPFVDPKNRETWISIGAFVENCVLSSQDMGYNANVTTLENEVDIEFDENAKNQSTQNIENIKKRLTIRIPYLNEKIDENI